VYFVFIPQGVDVKKAINTGLNAKGCSTCQKVKVYLHQFIHAYILLIFCSW